MLTRIYIKNFILIDEMELELEHGFYAITGETGSGKSIILDAINFCISGDANIDIIKSGKENLQVILTFSINENIKNLLEENGIEIEENQISISRSLSNLGKKKLLINNQPVTQKIINLFIEDIITIYAQHSLSALFKPSSHIRFLDNYMQESGLISIVQDLARQIRSKTKELEVQIENNNILNKEKEYLEHLVKEIESLKIKDNEEEELANQRIELQNFSKQAQVINDIIANIESSEVESSIASIIRAMTRSKDNEIFEPVIVKLEESLEAFSVAEQNLRELTNKDYSENNLELIEERLFAIRAIARKYNTNSTKLNDILLDAQHKLENIDNADVLISKLEKEISKLKKDFLEKSIELSEKRSKAAKDLEKIIKEELDNLEMFSCEFKIDIKTSAKEDFKETGIDIVSFVASTNPGMPFSPIDKIASGGEMARFMLALQVSFLSKSDILPVTIFDEVDTGIGGKVANSVGERLKKLSSFSQLIVVTHQPQVASKSSHHLLVKKQVKDNETISSAKLIFSEEKVLEIARMLSGKEITTASKLAASELIHS